MVGERSNGSSELTIASENGNGVGPTAIPISTYEALEDLFQPRGPSLRDFITLLKKRRKIVAITAAVIFSVGCLYALLADDQFTATSTVEIRGYSPVLGEGQLETLLQNDTRKILYQTTTTAKLNHLTLADDVLNTNDLGLEIKKYFRKRRSAFSAATSGILKVFGMGGQDNHLDEEDPRFIHRQTFLNSYLRLIQINPIHETSLVQVRATTTDRRLSQKIANQHAEGLIRLLATERRRELNEHLATLKSHADDLQKKLAVAEAAVASYAEKHELVGLTDGGQGNLMLSHLTELNKLLSAAQGRRAESESKMKKISEPTNSDSSLLDDETVKDLRTKLKEAESEYAAMSQLVTGEYPKLVELQGKISSLRKIIKEEREVNLSALRTQYQADLAAEQLLMKQFEEAVQKAHDMSNQLVQYNLLQREATSLRDLTQTVLKSLNETQIGASSVQDNVFVTDYAPLPRIPSAPRRNIIVVFSLVLGLAAGVGLAVLREVLDSTIKVSDDAQAALGIPTLGIIPSFKTFGVASFNDPVRTLRERFSEMLPGFIRARLPYNTDADDEEEAVASGVATEDEEIVIEGERDDESRLTPEQRLLTGDDDEVQIIPVTSKDGGTVALSEAGVLDALRTLRANILFSSTQNASRVIMVASAREREGKTSVISNLAVTFARASQRTLLVDGDLRGPKIARRFSIPKTQLGLVDLLAGQASLDEIIVQSWVPNLMIIPAGSPTVNPTELLGSERMSELIATLRNQFDVILFDAAPVLPVADSLMLAQFAETVIFVVRSRRTEKAVAQEGVRRLRRVGARVRGLVLNDFDPSDGSYSNDRYSVSKYKIFETVYKPGDSNGDLHHPDPTDHNSPDQPRRAVG